MHRFSGSPHASNPLTGNLLHLPNGINVIVTPVFGGYYFKVHELNTHNSAFPPGWTIVIHSEDSSEDVEDDEPADSPYMSSKIHRYRVPTLESDVMFISSISNPSNNDFRPPISPSRQLAMMLWATLWWYFHQPRPSPQVFTSASASVTEAGKPKRDWRIQIKRDGILKGRHLLSKLERMGLVATEESSVGIEADERTGTGFTHMFVSQRSFWQIDARLFLFTLSPTGNSPYPASSPYPSRPGSPNRDSMSALTSPKGPHNHVPDEVTGPFQSSSHLPTYYPPPPAQYILTNDIRHPLRPKPPRQGETFYTRYVPSMGQYLSFRAASLSSKCITYRGPYGQTTPSFLPPNNAATLDAAMSDLKIVPCDTELLNTWLNKDRVIQGASWDGCGRAAAGPHAQQESFLKSRLESRNSFPAIGCWDGKPFGYFEIYWTKEDTLGRLAGEDVRAYDRGLRVLVGEEEFRGAARVRVWLSALVHYCWLADARTERVLADPRVDQERAIAYFEECGFFKEREIAFPEKQAALMKIKRDGWEAPHL